MIVINKNNNKVVWYAYAYETHHECVMLTLMGIRKAKEPWDEAKCLLFYSMWVFIGSQHYTFWGL